MKPDFSQLRDIHTPAPVSWWPPALGWWALALLLLLLFAFTLWEWKRYQRNRWRRSALKELARLRDEGRDQVVREMSVLLRRVAISRYPREEVASLTGEAWLAFLDRPMGEESPFQSGIGRILLHGPYAPKAKVKPEALLDLGERWIKRLPGGAR